MKLKILMFFISVLMPVSLSAQERPFFSVGEKIIYNAVYNWGFIWLKAGTVSFSIEEKTEKNRNYYFLKSIGKSRRNYDNFFKVRDYFYSWVDKKTLKPVKYIRNTYENGYKVDNKYIFNFIKKKVYTETENSKKKKQKDTLKIKSNTLDLLSAIYYVRNIDFSKCELNKKIPINVIIDNEVLDLYVKYQGRESIKLQDKNYNCIKLSAMLVEGTIFKGGENIFIWLLDNENKIPIMVEAKILIGSVKAILKSYNK